MKFLTSLNCNLLFILIILFFNCQKGSCQACIFKRSDGTVLTDNDINFGFNLEQIEDTTPVNKQVLQLFVENVKNIESTTTSSTSGKFFMKPNLTAEFFELILTEDFPQYEEYETKDVISLTVTFECTTGSPKKIEFLLPVIDTNNHDPIFIDAPYSYKLSMPFPKGIPINLLGKISARDIDLTNDKILFSLDSNDDKSSGFNIEWSSTDTIDKKLHYATLISTSVINLNRDVTFNLFATDTGSPSRTTQTTVSIIVDKINSIIKFNNPIYVANYTDFNPENSDGLVLVFDEGDITLLSGNDGEKIEFEFKVNLQKYQDNFEVKSSDDYSTVQVNFKNPPESIVDESFLILTLKAKKLGTEETTVLHISLPGRLGNSENSDDTTTKKPDDNKTCDVSDDTVVEIIVLIVLLVIVTTALVVNIIRNMRCQIDPVVTQNGNESPPEMREIDRPETSNLARRSVTFIDEVDEVKVARL